MNKHLLQTRLRSIIHYGQELVKLNEATKATIDTREDVLQSLKEFWPYASGDVIVFNGQIVKVEEVINMFDAANPKFKVKYKENIAEVSGRCRKTSFMFL